MPLFALIADPDPRSAKLSSVVLSAAGWTVKTVTTVDEAQRALSQVRPDAVLVDLDLPPYGGLALARAMAADGSAHVPVIATSTVSEPSYERQAREAGCAGLITKPIDVKTFAASVRSMAGGVGR